MYVSMYVGTHFSIASLRFAFSVGLPQQSYDVGRTSWPLKTSWPRRRDWHDWQWQGHGPAAQVSARPHWQRRQGQGQGQGQGTRTRARTKAPSAQRRSAKLATATLVSSERDPARCMGSTRTHSALHLGD